MVRQTPCSQQCNWSSHCPWKIADGISATVDQLPIQKSLLILSLQNRVMVLPSQTSSSPLRDGLADPLKTLSSWAWRDIWKLSLLFYYFKHEEKEHCVFAFWLLLLFFWLPVFCLPKDLIWCLFKSPFHSLSSQTPQLFEECLLPSVLGHTGGFL